MTRILEGKTGVILGVANKRSIAWGCAKALSDAGKRLLAVHSERPLEETRLLVEQPGDVEIDRSVLLDAPGRYEHVTLRAGLPVGARFGGAPANFACSAAGLGAGLVDVGVVSAVGRDEPGEDAINLRAKLRRGSNFGTSVSEND